MQVSDILDTMDYGSSPEAADVARAWLDAHRDGFGPFIDGAFTAPGADAFAVANPATGERLATAARGSEADVDAAVAAAARAFPAWSAMPGHARARHLYALARLLQKRERFLAVLGTLDDGRPIRVSRDIDVPLAARHFAHHAGWAELRDGEFPGQVPFGVCGLVVSCASPLLTLARKVAPALAAGNTLVLKPAERTPLTALAFAAICRDAGLPPGVVNVVTGGGATGAALVRHPDVAKVAFTGSAEVGRAVRDATAGSGKALSLELGGGSTAIVFADADLDAAVEGVVDAAWSGGGRAGVRLLVQEGVAERFAARLRRRMANLRVGDPLDKSTDVGAVVDAEELRRIRAFVAAGVAEGAEMVQAGGPLPAAGCFFPPTLLAGLDTAPAWIPGPVVAATTFRTPAEAVALAGGAGSGLAASIWSQDVDLALDAAARVGAGVVWINATDLFDAAAPFGGTRDSGFGRDGGRAGMEEELRPRPAARVDAPERRPAPRPAGQAALGSGQDVHSAVEAAAKGGAWSAASAHDRARVLYDVAENLSARAREFADRLAAMTGASEAEAAREVEAAVRRTFFYAAWADKFDGRVPAARARHLTLALNEPFGVMGLVCPDAAPLLALVSLLMPALAMGNRAVAVPSARHPFAATDLARVFATSDVPAGAVSIVTGDTDTLAKVLAEHDEVAALWYAGPAEGAAAVERAAAGNLKFTWTDDGPSRDWFDDPTAQGRAFLHRATRIKTVWVPHGE